MRVEGLKLLNSNFYHQITISDNKIVVQRCDKGGRLVSRDDGVKLTPSDHPISEEIRKLGSVSTVDRVVEYYLDYSEITSISSVLFRERPYIIVESEKDNSNDIFGSDCSKRLKLRTEVPGREISVGKIFDKYEFDRDEFLANLIGDVKEVDFSVTENKTGYRLDKDNDKAFFFLSSQKNYSGKIYMSPGEIEFLYKAMSMIMGDNLVTVTMEEKLSRLDFLSSYYAMITPEDSHSVITMSRGLIPVALDFESSHNRSVMEKRREEDKINGRVYQMKMEGF